MGQRKIYEVKLKHWNFRALTCSCSLSFSFSSSLPSPLLSPSLRFSIIGFTFSEDPSTWWPLTITYLQNFVSILERNFLSVWKLTYQISQVNSWMAMNDAITMIGDIYVTIIDAVLVIFYLYGVFGVKALL